MKVESQQEKSKFVLNLINYNASVCRCVFTFLRRVFILPENFVCFFLFFFLQCLYLSTVCFLVSLGVFVITSHLQQPQKIKNKFEFDFDYMQIAHFNMHRKKN